jgi:Na+-translocating ferredoxin:NAD+ oxidoreductase subunit C
LIASVFSREVPAAGLPQDIGILCQNVGTAAAVARLFRDGEPLIRRIVTVTGAGIVNPGNLEARIGTPIASLIEDCGGYRDSIARLIVGGTMMGSSLPHAALALVKATNCIIGATADDLSPRGAEMPCIRCGECARVCPATLLPQQLHWHALANDAQALERFGLTDCIECGCCDYVCPSQIPLTERFRSAKSAVVAQVEARTRANEARAAFEAREDRLVRLETERRTELEAKRRALRRDDNQR